MKDLEGCIQRVAAFLQKDLKTEDVKKIAKLCSFGEMKKNPSVNHQWLTDLKYRDPKGAEFLRKGGYNFSVLLHHDSQNVRWRNSSVTLIKIHAWCCGIIFIIGAQYSWIIKILLVRWDVISWVTGLLHYNIRNSLPVVCLILVRTRDVNLWI